MRCPIDDPEVLSASLTVSQPEEREIGNRLSQKASLIFQLCEDAASQSDCLMEMI